MPGRLPAVVTNKNFYSPQPGNIRVRGGIGLRIRMPALYGDMSYLPPDNSPVLIMGLDDASLSIVPVGVGVLDNGVVASQGELDLRRLDFIGVDNVINRVVCELALLPVSL